MKRRLILLIAFALLSNMIIVGLSGAQEDRWLDAQITCFINDFKKTEDGKVFIKSHSEGGLRKCLLFLQYPRDNFADIHAIPDLCEYIWVIQEYFFISGDRPGLVDFFGFVTATFSEADAQNVPILTYLISACDTGVLGEELGTRYTRLFEYKYDLFITDLKERKDWKGIIRSLMAGDWRAFSAGLSKLGTSEFELELKEYVASLIKELE